MTMMCELKNRALDSKAWPQRTHAIECAWAAKGQVAEAERPVYQSPDASFTSLLLLPAQASWAPVGSSSGRELFAGCASTMPSLALIARSEANKYVYHQEKSGASSRLTAFRLRYKGRLCVDFPCLASMRSEITLDIRDINFGTTISENSENHTGKPLAASAFNRVHYNNNRRAHTDRSPLITP